MARRRFTSRPTSPGVRRQTVWQEVASGNTKIAVAASSAVLLASFTAAEDALRPMTAIRMRGRIIVSSDQTVANEEPQVVIGAIVVSDEAITIGITAIPDPVTNPDANWFMYEDCPTGILLGTNVGLYRWQSYDFDSKAMRKVGINESIAVVAANGSAADGAVIIVSGRILYKLH